MTSGGLTAFINSKYLSPLSISKYYENISFLSRLAWDPLYDTDERKNNIPPFDRGLALKSLKIIMSALLI
jgi:hypothetical protein